MIEGYNQSTESIEEKAIRGFMMYKKTVTILTVLVSIIALSALPAYSAS